MPYIGNPDEAEFHKPRPALFTYTPGKKQARKPTAAGLELGLTGKLRVENTDLWEGDHTRVPGPGKELRWNGVCRFLPMAWAERLHAQFARRASARSYCLSCHAALQPEVQVLPHLPGTPIHTMRMESVPAVYALALASDHDRQYLNHQVVVLDALSGDVIARNGYQPFSTSWG